jgi:transcription elongation factor Elf1
MKIKTITSQHRRDFSAILECEHCGHTQELNSGYDDDNYHRNVIPKFKCGECGKPAPENYRPLTTKYDANQIV